MDVITLGLLSSLVFFFSLGAAHRLTDSKGLTGFFAMVFTPGVVFAAIALFAFFLFLSNVFRPPVYNLNLNVNSVDYSAGNIHATTPDTTIDADIKGKQITGISGTMTPTPQVSQPLSSFDLGLRDLAPLSFALFIPFSYMGGYYLTDIVMGGAALSSLFRRQPSRPRADTPTRSSRPAIVSRSLGSVRLEVTPDMKLRLVSDP